MSMELRKLFDNQKNKNLKREEIIALRAELKYTDGRTKQSFKDETDINKIIQRAEKSGTISHLTKWKGSYSDFAEFDYFENLQKLTRGREIFDDLPAELRNEFRGSPAEFFDYVNNPANIGRLEELLPGLAAPGRQLMSVVPPVADTPPETPAETPATPETAAEPPTEPPVGG